jgi:hypothetical protein
MVVRNSFSIALLGLCVLAFSGRSAMAGSDVPDFNRDIRPILSENCFHCHGPDKASRKAKLRLDLETGIFAMRDGMALVAPGDVEASLLHAMITSDDPDEIMPPQDSKKTLTSEQIALLETWIANGAPWASHWAYQAPERPDVPAVNARRYRARNPIDHFVTDRLQAEGLSMSQPAKREQLLRRVSLDLIGLPPSPADVQAYVDDPSPMALAYEQAVNRLLASEHFGERWARPWLDLARYADSNGYQADQLRPSWAYRDWVIKALNANMPFDQFTIEQLAGDLLPKSTRDQKIATGFHRTVTCNVEAGVHAEENRVNQVVDRINTTSTVWLGSTLECAQCHDHKYDPFSTKDYYQLLAFFNSTVLEVEVPTKVSDVQNDFIGPYMNLATDSTNDIGPHLVKTYKPQKTLVMVELPAPRETRIMKRGNYLTTGDTVEPGVPQVLHPFDADLPRNRLGLAQWLVDRRNPLVARVTVNRWWAELFGQGLVTTPEDFGVQSEPSSHPELLDWLAVEFMESGWDMKHILKLMVTSEIYRQDSSVSPALLEADPKNMFYARAPRFRLNAERIRDNALSISGLLSTEMYGLPTMPYQPPNTWRLVGRNPPKWEEQADDNRWRRAVYIVHRRAVPYPSMVNFDAPDRSTCTVKRMRTNTPLQALTLLNDPAYVEMALALADRVLRDAPGDDFASRIDYAVRLATGRGARKDEIRILGAALTRQSQALAETPGRGAEMVQAASKVYRPGHADLNELAAWLYIGNILLNLDEVVTKG